MRFLKIIVIIFLLGIGNLQANEKNHYSSFDTCEKILDEALNKKSFSFISKLNFIDICEFEFDTHDTNPITYAAMAKYYDKTNYDLLLLNSFFSPKFTILPLILRQFLLIKKKPCIICPRGNLSPEALKLKGFKKKNLHKIF